MSRMQNGSAENEMSLGKTVFGSFALAFVLNISIFALVLTRIPLNSNPKFSDNINKFVSNNNNDSLPFDKIPGLIESTTANNASLPTDTPSNIINNNVISTTTQEKPLVYYNAIVKTVTINEDIQNNSLNTKLGTSKNTREIDNFRFDGKKSKNKHLKKKFS